MKVDTRAVLARAIEDGISYGLRRAHKHTDTPSDEAIESEIENGIWCNIDEIIKFEDFYEN